MQRHDRVYLRPGATFQFQCNQADPQLAARVMAWVALGRPLVAARQPADGGGLLLGLTASLFFYLSAQAIRRFRKLKPQKAAQASLPMAPFLSLGFLAVTILNIGGIIS